MILYMDDSRVAGLPPLAKAKPRGFKHTISQVGPIQVKSSPRLGLKPEAFTSWWCQIYLFNIFREMIQFSPNMS